MVFLHKHDYETALTDFGKALSLNPRDALAHSNRALAYYHKGEFDRAVTDCDAAIRYDPTLAVAWNNRCLAYFEQQKYDLAISDCTEAIRLRPNFDEARLNRGLAYARTGDNANARAEFDQVQREGSSEANRKRAGTLAAELDTRVRNSPAR